MGFVTKEKFLSKDFFITYACCWADVLFLPWGR